MRLRTAGLGGALRALLAAVVLVGSLGCETSLKDAAEKAARDPDFLFDSALSSIASRNFAAADRSLLRALELRPGDSRFLQTSCLVKTLLHDWTGAVAAADEALRRNPALIDVRNNRGIAYLELGRFEEAEREFRAVLADPTFPQTINPRFNLGIALLRQKKAEEALTDLYRVQKANPALPRINVLIGEAHEMLGHHDKAAANFLEAVKLDPKDATALVFLGRAFEGMANEAATGGNPEGRQRSLELAARTWKQAIEAAPASPAADEARRKLAEHEKEMAPVPSP